MTGKIKAITLFFTALTATALIAAMPGQAPTHIPGDLRDAPSGASDQLLDSGNMRVDTLGPTASRPERVSLDSKSIIGDDDRIEYYEAPREIKAMADAVAAMAVIKPAGGASETPPIPLCGSERFFDQPPLAFCTAFLVGKDLIATAGHCISAKSCPDTKFVFDFAVKRPGKIPTDLGPDRDTYHCRSVLVQSFTPKSRDNDMALVRVDRPVRGRKPLPLNISGKIVPEGTPVITIGHFLGVPLKISMNGDVRISQSLEEHSGLRWFTTSLDTFPGNSGGPIINSVTGLVEGINVRSGGKTGPHFDVTPAGCRVARVFPADEVWGPESTSITQLLPYFIEATAPQPH
jgi:hypothetical protein